MAARFRARQIRRVSDMKIVKNIAEEPLFNLSGRSSYEIYRLTLLDSANAKRTITRRLSQLNHLVRFRRTAGSLEDHGMSFCTFLRFISFGLCDPCKEIRAAAFRAIRHHTTSEHHCDQLHLAHVDFYIARALDVSLDNEMERIQAILLLRKMIRLGNVATSVINAIVAIVAEGGEERERMSRICLETLCELVLYCPQHPNIVSALRVLMEFLLESNCVPLTKAVVAVICHFSARAQNDIPAKFCDITQILHPVTALEGNEENSKQDARVTRTIMAEAAKIAIVAALRTWEGLHLLTDCNSGVRSLIGLLFLSNQLAQEAVLDIVTVLLYLPGDWKSGSKIVCESWSLQENFVADEAQTLLPHIGRTRVNLGANYLALLLFIFHQNGLIDGLVHVITAEGTFHHRAFHILNAYLALANIYLPSEFTSPMQSLPSLISLATNMSKFSSRVQSADTVAGLLQSNSKQGTVRGVSVYLEHVLEITAVNRLTDKLPSNDLAKIVQEGSTLLRDAVGNMTNNEYTGWDWHSILSLLKTKTIHRDDPVGYKFLNRLLFFFKPSNKLFASVPNKHESARCFTLCGCLFVEICVIEAPDLLEELLTDLYTCLVAVKETPNADIIFNALKILYLCVADYFIFVGRISSSVAGEHFLVKKKIFAVFMDFISQQDIHECYIKLIVTTLDYGKTENGIERALFEKIVTSGSPHVRAYATLHLRTLLRARMVGFSRWAMEVLISLTNDLDIVVARTAVQIIDEACDEKANLDVLVQANPSLQHLSPTAEFLTARILGTVQGFNSSSELVKLELVKWRTTFNRRYVTTVEQLLNSKLLASDFSNQSEKFLPELFLPEHLYGQLVRHIDGCDLVRMEMPDLIGVIKEASSLSALDVKAALWALGHIGRTIDGMALLNEFEALDLVVDLVAKHENVSVRGSAFLVIGLWSTTERGADLLKSRDWLAIRHDRHEIWPLVDQRVQYTWEDSSAWMSSQTLGQSTSKMSKPARILSYTTLPSAEARPQSPGMLVNENEFESAASMLQHKSSLGESGFESSDGGLVDSAIMTGLGDESRQIRSESAKTHTSEFSNGSVGSPICHDEDMLSEVSVSPEKYSNVVVEERTRKQPVLMRSKSGLHGSVDEIVSRSRRSESRLSFREMKNSFKQVVLKRHSNHISPIFAPVMPQMWSSGCRPAWGEPSAREEKFLGICLPVRRSVWSRHQSHNFTSSALLQKDVPCLHGQKIAGSVDSRSGLEIHTKENCLVCSVAGRDLSLVDVNNATVDQRKELLHLLSKLATPLGHKVAEQGLLQLKNQLPQCFMDPCLYTEVCHLLASFTYKLSIRRLIQELFLDVPIQNILRSFVEAEMMESEACLEMKIVEAEA